MTTTQICAWEGSGDDVQLQDLLRALDSDTEFMLASPGERSAGLQAPSFTLVAERDEQLVGYIDVRALPWARARGRGHIIVGVRASHHRQGIGRALLEAAVKQARERGMWRLEMTTMVHNIPALNLYISCGFVIEGLRRCSLELDGRPMDEYYLARVLR